MKVEQLPPLDELVRHAPDAGVTGDGEGLFDHCLDGVLARSEYLLTHGAFHIKLHFSGEQMTCWWFNDPLRYQVYRGDEVLGEQVLERCSEAEIMGLDISEARVGEILQGFRRLRLSAGNTRLRSGSLNRVNGMLGLSFACDRIHYLSHRDYADFLDSLEIAG